MSYPIVEAAREILSGRISHPITSAYPWSREVLSAKANWWENDVHTIAREDEHKYANGLLELAWGEFKEAVIAPPNEKLVEYGDVMVFLAAVMARDALVGVNPRGVILMEQLYLAKYVDDNLRQMGNVDDLVPRMVEQVFDKLGNNFHPQLNPPIPADASRKSVGVIYQRVYQASRNMRGYAKQVMGANYDGNKGMPSEWRSVYHTNGSTPDHLQPVHDLALEQMKGILKKYKEELGDDATRELGIYWKKTAPGMIGALVDLI